MQGNTTKLPYRFPVQNIDRLGVVKAWCFRELRTAFNDLAFESFKLNQYIPSTQVSPFFRFWFARTRVFGLGIVIATFAIIATSTSTAADEAFPYGVQLSSEASDPYRFFGRPAALFREKTKRAIKDYFEVRQCLVGSERNKPHPDLRLLDWDAMGSDEAVEVCIFRLAASFQNPETMKTWFEYHGFQVFLIKQNYKEATIILTAVWDVSKHGTKFPSRGFFHLISRVFVYGQNITIHWNDTQTLQGVDTTLSIE